MSAIFTPPDGKIWYNVWDADTLVYICAVSGDPENPFTYDPRIGGSGNVIWQAAAVEEAAS